MGVFFSQSIYATLDQDELQQGQLSDSKCHIQIVFSLGARPCLVLIAFFAFSNRKGSD